MTVLLTPEAEADIEEAHDWYREHGLGLAADFARAIRAALSSIERFPEGYPVVYRSIRRALLRRFPYGLFYVPLDDLIYVVGCFHSGRDPSAWERRLDV